MCKMKDWCQFLKKYKFDNLATYISLFSFSDLISFCFVHRIHRGRDPAQVRQGRHGAAPWGVVRLPAGVYLLGRQLGPPRAPGILTGQNYISVKSQDGLWDFRNHKPCDCFLPSIPLSYSSEISTSAWLPSLLRIFRYCHVQLYLHQ